MASVTTNFGFDVPTSSDLVKNGATAISTLGQDIDTFLAGGVGFAAGKNKIINGDFSINQRNFTSVTADDYGFDRWQAARSGATLTYTPQTFTIGAAPVAGYEAKNFARLAVSVGNDLCRLQNKIENVRTFAGQTVTVSFWAKGTNPTTAGNLAVNFQQNFGTGGSPTASINTAQQTFVLTANWTRYSLTFAIPSISGKTIGTNEDSSLQLWIGQGTSIATDSWTLDLWGVQVEAGSTATPFQTATGTIQGELALCKRYLPSILVGSGNSLTGYATATTNSYVCAQFDVQARVAPTGLTVSGTSYTLFAGGGGSGTPTAIAFDSAGVNSSLIQVTTTAGSPTLAANNAVALRSTAAASQILFTGCEL